MQSFTKYTINFILVIILLFLICAINRPAYACEENVKCENCSQSGEFSWNPSGQHITTSLIWFYEIETEIEAAYESGDYAEARELIEDYLNIAKKYKCNWNYGNAIHNGNRYLGLISLEHGDIEGATEYLVKAGKSSGSPQLNAFGPKLDLANILLQNGNNSDVITYLKDIKIFWKNDGGLVEEWLVKIANGETPKLTRVKNTDYIFQILITISINVLIGTFFLWLAMKFVNKFMVDKHTQIKCPFWKLLVAVAVSSVLSFIPMVGWLLSIIVFFFLVMTFTGAMVFEVLIMVLISKFTIIFVDYLVGFVLVKYLTT